MTPYYMDEDVTLYNGRGVEVLASLPANSVGLVLTDPPYNVSEEGADITADGEVKQRRDFGEWDRSGWHPGPLLEAAFHALRPGGSLLAFCSDRLLAAYREHPAFAPRGTVVWEKTNPPPTPRPSYVSATEWIVWLQKPGSRAVWNGGGFVPNILRYPICGGAERTEHPTQKPVALIRELMARHSERGDLVVDPYSGSGTTLVAAKHLDRRAVGAEIDPAYCAIAARRIRRAEAPVLKAVEAAERKMAQVDIFASGVLSPHKNEADSSETRTIRSFEVNA